MKIVIESNYKLNDSTMKCIKSGLENNLKKFYGDFIINEFFNSFINDSVVNIYLSENILYDGFEKDIKTMVTAIVRKYTNCSNINVRLNKDLPEKIKTDFPVSKSEEAHSMNTKANIEYDFDKLSENYHAEEPRFTFDQVILSDSLREKILEAVATIQVETKVFDEWGLRSIIPNASSVLSFFGVPGTGKSMAAEAIANKLGKKILRAAYADIESKYHGEGPKMVKAIFKAAEREDAVLFIDEAESLLSQRLKNVTDGSAQAINSMRSQLLICLEQFKGIVIFATNLVISYDKAFLSRLINIEFTTPDPDARLKIWNKHLTDERLRIPLSEDIDLNEIAVKYEFCGREIRNAVKDACVTVALSGRNIVSQSDIIKACEKIINEKEAVSKAEDHTAVLMNAINECSDKDHISDSE